MKKLFFLLVLLPHLAWCQAPVLDKQKPMQLSEHVNSKSFILDYLITEDSTCDLVLESGDSTKVTFLQSKFIRKGQYELGIPATHFKSDTIYIKLSCSYGMAEIRHIVNTD